MKRQLQTVVYGAVLLASLASLSACAPLILGGAVMTGVVATDRRTTGTQVEDETIEFKVANAVRQEMGERIHLNVTSFNRQVLLSGAPPPTRSVPKSSLRARKTSLQSSMTWL